MNNAETPQVNSSSAINQYLQQAVEQHQSGKLNEAEKLYQRILQLNPNHPEANHNMGVLLLQTQKADVALRYFNAALDAEPTRGQFWLSYVDALFQDGQLETARKILAFAKQQGLQGDDVESLALRLSDGAQVTELSNSETQSFAEESRPVASTVQHNNKKELNKKSTNLNGSDGAAVPNSGGIPSAQEINTLVVLSNSGRYEEALTLAHAMTERFPLYEFGWKALGVVFKQMGRNADALLPIQKAAELLPNDAEAHYNLGVTFHDLGRLSEAETSYRRALRIKPNYADAHYNLGNILKSFGRLDEAETSYRQALQINPNYWEALTNLGVLLNDLKRYSEAEDCCRRVLQANPGNAIAHNNLGNTLKGTGRLVESESSYRRALEIAPENATIHQNLANNLAFMSKFDQVVSECDMAQQLQPDDPVAWEQRLYAFSYHPDLTAQEIYGEFIRWGDRFPDPVVDFSAHDRTPGRRLRIGYVSPDFRRHTSRFYFWPLFANHDHTVVELYAYSNVKLEDDFTQKFKGLFDHWRNIRGVADGDVARMIREDGIDILVDACSHMLDERLGVFTQKPAPIQVTWLGAAWTTGLKMVDYALIDPYMAPEGTLTRETIVRLPHSFVAYRPPEETAEIAPLPCLKNGYITFGYSGRTERLNHHTFRVWGEILKQNPTARLILDYRAFADLPTQDHYRQFMAQNGMDYSRVIMRRSENIFEGLNDIDILLDSFPHSGGTMLFDALWMGVPILTLASRPPVGRIGTSLMMNLGLPEWVAQSQEEYTAKAGALVQDIHSLAELRAGMRERMQNSPLMDGPGFARGVEAAYREMFEKWIRECHI